MIRYTVQNYLAHDEFYVLKWTGGGAVTGVNGPLTGPASARLDGYTFDAILAAWANSAQWGAPTLELITPDPPVPTSKRSPAAGPP